MEKLTEKIFLAMADELTPLNTLDKNTVVYFKKEDNKVSFYSKYIDRYNETVDNSYYYMFSITLDSFTSAFGSIDIIKLYESICKER